MHNTNTRAFGGDREHESVQEERGKAGEHSVRTAAAERNHAMLKSISISLIEDTGPNWHRHSLAALKVEALARILHYNNLYQKILDVPGVICEFGVQWGATLSEMINLRNIYEPYNSSRTVFGFDTFEGFRNIHEKDGRFFAIGDYSSKENYEEELEHILSLHESFSAQPDLRRFSLVKGDACQTIDTWLEQNPHAIIAMAIFDMDLYEPTQVVLRKILPRLTKGSVLVFDELNCPHFPGETRGLDDAIGLRNLRLRRTSLQPYASWAIYGE